jgi:hypothetical protein
MNMPLPEFIKRVEGSLSSYFGVWNNSTEQKVVVAEELAKQALEQADDEFKLTRNVDHLRNAASLLQQAIDTVAEGHGLQNFKRDKALSGYIHDLKGLHCLALRKLYFETGQSELLDQIIDTLQQTYIPVRLSLRSVFWAKFYSTGTLHTANEQKKMFKMRANSLP